MPLRYYNSEGIVLRTYDLGEADRIVVILSPWEGSIRAVAKGVRRPRSRLAAYVQMFTQARFMFYRGRQLDTITQAEVLCAHRELRSDLDRMTSAAYASELAGEVAREKEPAVELYRLLAVTLATLSVSPLEQLDMVLRRFELGLLNVSGYAPQLLSCVHCGGEREPFVFSTSAGGIVCNECRSIWPGRELAPAVLANLRALGKLPFSKLGILRMNIRAQRELESLLQEFIQFRLEFRPKTLQALSELRNLRRE